MEMERKYFVDRLRWMAILLLFPFHAVQIYSGGEYYGFYIWSHTNMALYAFSTAVYPWYMTLLFVLAGMSCKYALSKRTIKQFIQERTKKLFIPFLFGLLVLVPIMTYTANVYFHWYAGTYWQYYPTFFTTFTDLTGYDGGFTPAHLWFLFYLFIISLIVLPIILLQKKYSANFQFENISYICILFMFIPEWLCLYIINIGGKSLGQFMFLFLIGYFILSNENVLKKIKQYRWISTIIFILMGVLYVYLYCFTSVRHLWMDGLYVAIGWMGIVTMLGIGQSLWNMHRWYDDYWNKASFPIYIIHMPVLVVIGYFILKFPLGVIGQFSLIVMISFILTILIYEIIKRIPVLRFFLGISKQKI